MYRPWVLLQRTCRRRKIGEEQPQSERACSILLRQVKHADLRYRHERGNKRK